MSIIVSPDPYSSVYSCCIPPSTIISSAKAAHLVDLSNVMTSVSASPSGAPDIEEDCKMIDSLDGAGSCQESEDEDSAAEIEYRKVREQASHTKFLFLVRRHTCQPIS